MNNSKNLELFFAQSLDGIFFMMLDQPIRWDNTTDKEQALDYVFAHQRMTSVNDAMLAQYGASREQFLGMTPGDFYAHDLAYGRKVWRKFFDEGRLHIETYERKLDGTPIWIEGDYICLYDDEGRITGHFGIQRETTARKQAEEALLQTNQRLELLREIDSAILAARSPEQIAQAAMRHIQQLLPCLRASVAVFDFEREVATLIAVHSSSETKLSAGAEVPLAVFGSIELLRQGIVHKGADIESVGARTGLEIARVERLRSYLNVPLLAQEDLIGALNLGWAQANAFTDAHIEIAREVADSLAIAIYQARLHAKVTQHAVELEKRVAARTAELRESEGRLRAITRALPDLVFVIDEDGRHLQVLTAQEHLLYQDVEQISGRLLSEIFTHSVADRFLRYVRQTIATRQTGIIEYELPISGEIRCFEARTAPLGQKISGKECIVWIARDITERKRIERALRDSEERLRAIGDALPDLVFVVDEEGYYLEILTSEKNLLYIEQEKLKGRRIHDVFPTHEADRFVNAIRRAIDTGESEFIEYQLKVPAGMRWFEGRTGPMNVKFDGKRCGVFVARDISDRKRAEELQGQNIYLQEELRSELNYGEIIGASEAMQKVFRSIEMVAATDSTVLLLGETGTGKELIARAIHNSSAHKNNVLIKVNCAALPATLVESELFGHEKGAFTGATAQKKGRFELAHNGTIFLDEVGELPLETQIKLLRVLQEHEFERVGGTQTIKVKVRVIAATNRDLEAGVKNGNFRADLYYRLNIFPIKVPPLRDHKDDIPLLAMHFVTKFAERMGKQIDRLSGDALDRLARCDWPGNVRELANIIERAVILCQGKVLQKEHLSGLSASKAVDEHFLSLEEAERRHILQALERTGGVLAGPHGAARLLGVNRSTLWSRMQKLAIKVTKKPSIE